MRTTLVLALLVMVSSCLKVDIVLPEQEATNVSLSFISRDIAQTRAAAGTEKGDGSENVVESIDVFFYDEDAGDDGDDDNALYHMRIEDNDLVASADNSTDNINYSYTASIPTDVIKEIFGENTTCNKIYAIANISADTEFQSTSITDLKETILNTDFSQSQTSFVMSGESSNITFDSSERKISGSVNLYRSASKIDLIIKKVLDIPVTDEYGNQKKDSDGKLVVWKADTENMIVSLQKGVKKSYIDYIDGYCELLATDYFNTRDVKLVKDGDNGWKHPTPFYTYPSNWEKEAATETYLKLIVPWSKSDAPGVNYNTYYTIPISETGLVRNTYYKIELTVGRLGTFDEGEDVVLTPASYYIYNWSTNDIYTELLDYRYLVVNQKEYTIYNQEELYIPFRSSHETMIDNITFAQQDITGTTASWTTIASNNSNYWTDLEIVGNQIYFRNILDNVYTSSTFDFTPYRLTFRIKHTGTAGTTYYEDITVYQYPAIYGSFRQNSDYSENGGQANGDNGYVYVNGYQGSSAGSGTDYFLSANGVGGIQGTYSPNMYEFTITSVEGTNYVIGDPREINVTYNENSAKWASAVTTQSSQKRELSNYYGTENSTRTRNMIAPKFRIASAYGALSTVDASKQLETLRKRCASYQEDGYPAGRWRLPTEAEFKFIMTQVNRSPATLPPMYLKGYEYWCAHGLGIIAQNGNTTVSYVTSDNNEGHSTRCVYDTWYWGDERLPNPDVFTWGDMPR